MTPSTRAAAALAALLMLGLILTAWRMGELERATDTSAIKRAQREIGTLEGYCKKSNNKPAMCR